MEYYQPTIPDLPIHPVRARRQRRSSDLNHIRDHDRAAHDWYRFVLSFPPHLVQKHLEDFAIRPDQTVLDPFCGTGTTVVECKKLGIPSVGVEANKMAWFAGTTKVNWHMEADRLMAHATQIAELAHANLDQPLRTLDEERSQLLLKNSISELPLHKALVLLDQLEQHRDENCDRYEKLALAKILVYSVSNLKFAPEVSVGKYKQDAPVIELWLNEMQQISRDLQHLHPLKEIPATVHHADSRSLLQVLEPNSIDAVITSPPYPNEKDYTRATRLESVVLGFLQTKIDLRSMKQGLMRSNSRGVYRTDDDDHWVANHPEIQRIAAEIEAKRIELKKTSGFERQYARATKLYFGGMARHLADLRQALRPGAQLAYVVGDQASYFRVMIRTGELIADLAKSLGYEVVDIELFRTRLATATKEQLREEVVLLKWNGSESQY
ncbi:DNA methyltransferase [Leptolyngbya boryana CZ1]|uniref:site-specific DNA-methyltransferase (cytosine-N(4)-specific) n=1 Tax=Leptolyngbya boryana CZ1 TaxID=3060204 RepID=A0AA97AQG5_LEPBY|nr:DNA methyltransferase [Leptolyngbya boryana]WNZ43405.1 DNA methyltransferase [Leptolyngbya boryana CZ1]